MFTLNANTNSSIGSMESLEKFGKVNINETDHFVFYNLRGQMDQKDIFLSDKLDPYIDVFFQ